MKFILLILTFINSIVFYGQTFLHKNESKVFSFTTTNGKNLVIAKDTANSYIIYRFGTKDKVEFEYPSNYEASLTKFKYSFYLRGGGIQNEGMDLNYLYFSNDGFKYIVYDTYYAAGQIFKVGVKIINLKTKKATNITGNYKTRKGTLTDFRNNNLIQITEELFE